MSVIRRYYYNIIIMISPQVRNKIKRNHVSRCIITPILQSLNNIAVPPLFFIRLKNAPVS